jgi:hypothetical protein
LARAAQLTLLLDVAITERILLLTLLQRLPAAALEQLTWALHLQAAQAAAVHLEQTQQAQTVLAGKVLQAAMALK